MKLSIFVQFPRILESILVIPFGHFIMFPAPISKTLRHRADTFFSKLEQWITANGLPWKPSSIRDISVKLAHGVEKFWKISQILLRCPQSQLSRIASSLPPLVRPPSFGFPDVQTLRRMFRNGVT